jgi:phosphoglycolate phosphatase-like HAD superfamily hydrolase
MRGRPFPHVVDTLKKLKEDYGMTIFVITARSDGHKEYTENQLKAFGMSSYIEQIYMWKDADWTDEFEADVVTFKSKEREKIREQGYHILLAVGDRHQDLTHYDDEDEDGNGALNILIENPFT